MSKSHKPSKKTKQFNDAFFRRMLANRRDRSIIDFNEVRNPKGRREKW